MCSRAYFVGTEGADAESFAVQVAIPPSFSPFWIQKRHFAIGTIFVLWGGREVKERDGKTEESGGWLE
jgi:hypothetical protein